MLSPSLWRDADRTASEPRHDKCHDVGGGLTAGPETWKLWPVPSQKTLERLDVAVAHGWEKQRGGSERAGLVAAPAPARIEPFAALDALGERAKPTFEDRLAGDNPRRDRYTAAAGCQVRGNRKGRSLRVREPIMTLHRLGVRLEQRHHAAFGRGQRSVL